MNCCAKCVKQRSFGTVYDVLFRGGKKTETFICYGCRVMITCFDSSFPIHK